MFAKQEVDLYGIIILNDFLILLLHRVLSKMLGVTIAYCIQYITFILY